MVLNEPFLSIVIPIYNAENYLRNNLSKLRDVNDNCIEFILVNDGSVDSSLSICEEFVKIDNRFKIINKKNGGVSSARNIGIEAARGKYIFFLDGDDSISPYFLDVIRYCVNKNIDFVFFNRWFLNRNCIEYRYSFDECVFKKVNDNLYDVVDVTLALKQKCFLSGSGEVLLKRNLIKNIRFDIGRNLLEDYDFFFKVLYYNKLNVCYCDKIVTLINDNVPNSLTKIKVPLNTSEWQTKKFLVDINPFFIGNKYLSNRFFWIESYFYMKKFGQKDRFKYVNIIKRSCIKHMGVNKYFIGFVGLVLGVDINKVRIVVKKYIRNGLRVFVGK